MLKIKINYTAWITLLGLLVVFFSTHDLNSKYGHPINGDAKGYYAYLPALFIYGDADYSFIEKIEKKYYPEDGSQFKEFRNRQANGRYVNKTFPGLSLLYAPFFFLSMLIAWIFGFSVDGYSAPFQVGIAVAHWVYLMLAFRFLLALFREFKVKDPTSLLLFAVVLFGTNVWYYIVFDFSVSHVFSFFLCSVLLWLMNKWVRTEEPTFFGWITAVMAIIVITRPTNAIMILFLPFIGLVNGKDLNVLLKIAWKSLLRMRWFIVLSLLILVIPLLLWKWQSDLWLVYSYNEEGFYFSSPQLTNFLFSYQKGWLLWNPILFLGLITAGVYCYRRSYKSLIYFFMPLVIIVYVLSSWWIWTYGSGMGQRVMIEFYPWILFPVALLMKEGNRNLLGWGIAFPFMLLNVAQAYQINASILNGGNTTRDEYWSEFLNLKKDPPRVVISKDFELSTTQGVFLNDVVDEDHAFSSTLEMLVLPEATRLVLKATIVSMQEPESIQIVVSADDGSFYRAYYPGEFLSEEQTTVHYELELPKQQVIKRYMLYVWNGESQAKAEVKHLRMTAYKMKEN